jgi:hypothetical protein
MPPDTSRKLYAVEPDGQRFMRWLYEFTRRAARVYWDIAVALPVTILSMGLALLFSGVCILDLFQKSRNIPFDLIALAISIPFLGSRRFRVFVWTWFACQVGWLVLLLALILPFTGPDFDAKTNAARTLLAIAYFAPPLFLAIYFERLLRAGDSHSRPEQ